MNQVPGADAIFLAMETDDIHAHIGGLTILDPSEAPDFGFEKLKALTRERIQLVPRFTWKLREVPFDLDRPYWTPDPDFDVDYHMHRIGCPSPGGLRELAEVCGDLFSHKIDRRRPLWELWYIEGLERGRVGLFMKTHHCLIDGASGMGLAEVLYDLQPDPPPRGQGPKKPRLRPERVPGDLELALRGLGSALATPFGLMRFALQALNRGITLLSYRNQENAPPLLPNVPRVSFNDAIGSKRAFACASVPLSDVKELRKHCGVKVNDVILELSAGAVARYLRAQGEMPKESLVVSCAVSTREPGDTELGNRIGNMVVPWATDIEDPGERLQQIHKNTQASKEMTRALRAKKIQAMGDTAPPAVINLALRALTSSWVSVPVPSNTLVSNVPGPPFPLYTAGAKLEAMYPLSILMTGMGLNITVISYANRVDFGFTVDPDLVPDPWYLADGIPLALEELKRAVGLGALQPLRAVGGEPEAEPRRGVAGEPERAG